jgi:hypothetical protein
MRKLIAQFVAQPTQANRDKLAKYVARHPMAWLYATQTDIAGLRAIGALSPNGQHLLRRD